MHSQQIMKLNYEVLALSTKWNTQRKHINCYLPRKQRSLWLVSWIQRIRKPNLMTNSLDFGKVTRTWLLLRKELHSFLGWPVGDTMKSNDTSYVKAMAGGNMDAGKSHTLQHSKFSLEPLNKQGIYWQVLPSCSSVCSCMCFSSIW